MRAEEIIKESELYAGYDQCYIHIEKTQGNGYKLVMTGDPKSIMGGIFAALMRLSQYRDVPYKTLLETLKSMGKHVQMEHKDVN